MAGLTNLQKTLAELEIICDDVDYGFATIDTSIDLNSSDVLATFAEDKNLTVVASIKYLAELRLDFEGPFAKLTIEIHTSLELVGLTAALSTQLTEAGISANVMAAYYHDHIFVPYDQRDKAISSILELKQT